jgi:hypothetical protein
MGGSVVSNLRRLPRYQVCTHHATALVSVLTRKTIARLGNHTTRYPYFVLVGIAPGAARFRLYGDVDGGDGGLNRTRTGSKYDNYNLD